MDTEHKLVRLSAAELRYLKNAGFLLKRLARILETAQFVNDETCSLSLSGSVAEEFRSAFTDRLAKVGFDAGYELTSEGRSLESLIDRFDLSQGA